MSGPRRDQRPAFQRGPLEQEHETEREPHRAIEIGEVRLEADLDAKEDCGVVE